MAKVVGHTKEDVATLPRWAQQRIKRLESDVANLSAEQESTREKTNVMLAGGHDSKGHVIERGLPRGSKVRFYLNNKKYLEVGIRPSREGDNEDVVEVYSPGGSLVVLPAVSNVIQVRVNR